MSLVDGTAKMSKSAEAEGSRINLTDAADEIAKKIKRCKVLPFPPGLLGSVSWCRHGLCRCRSKPAARLLPISPASHSPFARPLSHALDIRLIQHFSSAHGLVRRWRLLGCFPIQLITLLQHSYNSARTRYTHLDPGDVHPHPTHAPPSHAQENNPCNSHSLATTPWFTITGTQMFITSGTSTVMIQHHLHHVMGQPQRHRTVSDNTVI
jgi:hypothetical protein